MFILQKYKDKKFAIYGMGKSGCSVASELRKIKAKIYCWDDNKKTRNKIKLLNFPINKFWINNNRSLIDYIVISPGIDINKCKLKNFLKQNNKKILTDLDLFFSINKNAFIISVTGTNGKSTTCKIIEKILKTAGFRAKVGGNIGKPVLSLGKAKKKDIFILEISSYQLQYSKLFRSNHAAILNISPDHLERHKSINNYINIKSKIFFEQKKTDYSYINSTNKFSKSINNIIKKNKIKSNIIKINKKNYQHLIKNINNRYFQSKGNIENMAFAYMIVKKLGVKDSVVLKALNNFRGLPHRQEITLSNKNLTCINDSKATSFDACMQSLTNFNKIYWIVGGMPKQKDSFNLKNVKHKIIKAYIIGNNANFFKKQINKKVPFTISHNIKNAIENIINDIKKNKIRNCNVLLSPAAASFDQFSNFEERGFYFNNLVKKRFKKISNV